jgi:hypothetical protein
MHLSLDYYYAHMHLLARRALTIGSLFQECELCRKNHRRPSTAPHVRQAARHVSQIYDSYLALEGLRTTQYSILAKLNRLGPLSINELAD